MAATTLSVMRSCKYVARLAFEAISPDVRSCGCVNELAREPKPIAAAPHAALQQVADAEFASDLSNIDRLAPVGERRISGDDEEPVTA
jgi:hypothetical protein